MSNYSNVPVFTGRYFNGLTSKVHYATILLEADSIVIGWLDPDGQPQRVDWALDQIHRNDANISGKAVLTYGSFPYQTLEVDHHQFIQFLSANYPRANFTQNTYRQIAHGGWKGIAFSASAIIFSLAMFFLYGLPFISSKFVEHLPIQSEKQLGKPTRGQMVGDAFIDARRTRLMNEFFAELRKDDPYDTRIYVVNDSLVNAFALPGGYIFVYKGLLDRMENPEELVALLGHEFGHVRKRHSTRTIARVLSSYMLINIITNDVGGFSATVVDNANTLYQLKFSREFETEADESGMDMLEENHLNPQGMVQMFSRLKAAGGDMDQSMEWASTHPIVDNRIQAAEDRIRDRQYTPRTTPARLLELWKAIKAPSSAGDFKTWAEFSEAEDRLFDTSGEYLEDGMYSPPVEEIPSKEEGQQLEEPETRAPEPEKSSTSSPVNNK